MNRTYHINVDNGLYVLAYYIDKNVKEITIEDIMNSTSLFADKFEEYSNCSYYKKTISMGFQNSSYTQGLKKDKETQSVIETRAEKVKNQFDLMLKNIGDDEYCTICGEKHIKINSDGEYLKSMSRSFMPKIHANTFANYINNLKMVNICPICLYLSMLSLYNTTKTGDTLTLYISDNDEFMEEYTYQKQAELEQNIAMNLQEDKKNQKSYYKHIEEVIENIIHSDKIYNSGYIKAVGFCNSAQVETYKENYLSKKDIKFVRDLEIYSLLSEFKEKDLFKILIDKKLQNNYLIYVIDFKNKQLKVSTGLFNKIEEVYCKLSKDKLELIKTICGKVYKTNTKDEIKQLNETYNLKQFENLILKWGSSFKEATNENLFTLEEFDSLCNIKEYTTIKNRMLAEFIFLHNNK